MTYEDRRDCVALSKMNGDVVNVEDYGACLVVTYADGVVEYWNMDSRYGIQSIVGA